MSKFECTAEENDGSWVLVHFLDSDPGKEFEILSRTRLSAPEHVALRPRLKVKVFYGKAKIEAYVVLESNDYDYLQKNIKTLSTNYMLLLRNSIFVSQKDFKRHWDCDISSIDSDCEERPTKIMKTDDTNTVLVDQYNSLKTKFDDLYRIQCVMRSAIGVLMDRVETLSDQVTNSIKENKDGKVDEDNVPEEPEKEEEEYLPPQKRKSKPPLNEVDADTDGVVYIGDNKTPIAKEIYESTNWNSYSAATRKLLVAVFSKEILATHSLTGKPSPAFLNANKVLKQQLDPRKTADIIAVVTRRCNVSASLVRGAITTKCADENKMCKKRKLKK